MYMHVRREDPVSTCPIARIMIESGRTVVYRYTVHPGVQVYCTRYLYYLSVRCAHVSTAGRMDGARGLSVLTLDPRALGQVL